MTEIDKYFTFLSENWGIQSGFEIDKIMMILLKQHFTAYLKAKRMKYFSKYEDTADKNKRKTLVY